MEIEKDKICHKPSTKEFITSLGSMLQWSKILLTNVDKHYNAFLEFLTNNKFYRDSDKPLVIKDVAADYGKDATKVSKWL
jgi:hypothetical protein